MRVPPRVRMLPDGVRLHLQDGPIDLVIRAFGTREAIEAAYRAAVRRFIGVLDELCGELADLRRAALPAVRRLCGPIAGAMERAVIPFAATTFITPMAAVAGAVADDILGHMLRAADLDRAFVNNGGDIALHVSPGRSLRVGLVDRPDRPSLFGGIAIAPEDGVRGIATSGWRGRSFSLGIADSVTVLAASGAEADAAATHIANAVDLPGHPAVRRAPASSLQPDSDLGERLVTRDVGALTDAEIDEALARGLERARALTEDNLIVGAALRLQGATRVAGPLPLWPRRDRPPDPLPIACRELHHA